MSETSPSNSGSASETASVARAYDYALGGKDNFEIDREFADAIIARDPEVRVTAKLNKEFGRRVTQYMAHQGVGQFLDLGSGIPTSPPSVHDSARRILPDARVVYVDHDPVVVAHNRALRADGPGLVAIEESFADMAAVLGHPDVISHLDFSQPVGVLALSVFQNTPDDAVADIVHNVRQQLVPGSYLAISHISDRTDQTVQDAFHRQTAEGRYPATQFRSSHQIQSLFDGFDLVEPGVVDYRDWHPDDLDEEFRPDLTTTFECAVGRLR